MPLAHAEVTSETAPLQSVILGYPDNFNCVPVAIINEAQRRTYETLGVPRREDLMRQYDALAVALAAHGVTVLRPQPVPDVPDQLMARDIGVVIGRTFVITHMAAPTRQPEWRGIIEIVESLDADRILRVPNDIVLEGGDIIVDHGRIFVGVGQRTTPAGPEWLAAHFPDYDVVKVPLKGLADGEDVLHLDCAFVPVGDDCALIYQEGLQAVPAAIADTYRLLDVTAAEQRRLSTNVLSLSPTTVISRPSAYRINTLLRQQGLKVIEVPFSEAPKTGGSFRCATLPLWRG